LIYCLAQLGGLDMYPKKIIIAGGGTAGWMSASLLQHSWPNAHIILIESENIGTIGVGEGSTPYLKEFFKKLKIADQEWMPKCNATYKSGIEFPNWSERAGYESYFHPFFSHLDIETGELFFKQAKAQKRGVCSNAHPDYYFVNTQIAKKCKAPRSETYQNLDIDYGYHFDAGLLATFLKDRCLGLGLINVIDDIVDVEVATNGDISSLVTKNSGAMNADLFLDCTGFKGLLIQKALNVKFISFKDNLFNDSAVAIQTPKDSQSPIKTSTCSTALSSGWAWQIPLTNRYGNGYVYSSEFINEAQAEQELKEHLNISHQDNIKVKHLKMKVGRVAKHWHKNCLAVGLSQGFIEPLEATALMLVQFTLEEFIKEYSASEQQVHKQESFNNNVNHMIEGVRDYIVTHYKVNSKSNSEYWAKCREHTNISDNLSALLDAWGNPEAFEEELEKQQDSLAYLRPSWYIILAGMGLYPEKALKQDNSMTLHSQAQEYCESVVNKLFPDHREYLNRFNV
jgi:2-polyprenyl-6-methoxyphenol hydroxylase-like FAD-dependent oxidoreductase